jgi:hypothetical protein
MYLDDCSMHQRIEFWREKDKVARKNHQCCECGKDILPGEKYYYFVGKWQDSSGRSQLDEYKTCLDCKKDWSEILNIFHKNCLSDACIVFELLNEAVQQALEEGLLDKNDTLAKKWLTVIPEIDIENLTSEERNIYEKKIAFSQMKIHSIPLL